MKLRMNCVNLLSLWGSEASDEMCQFTFTFRQPWMTMIKLHEATDELCQSTFTFRQPWMTKVKLSWSYGWTVSIYFHFQAAMNDTFPTWLLGSLWLNHAILAFRKLMDKRCPNYVSLNFRKLMDTLLICISGSFWINYVKLAVRKPMDQLCPLAFRKLLDKLCQYSCQEAYGSTMSISFQEASG